MSFLPKEENVTDLGPSTGCLPKEENVTDLGPSTGCNIPFKKWYTRNYKKTAHESEEDRTCSMGGEPQNLVSSGPVAKSKSSADELTCKTCNTSYLHIGYLKNHIRLTHLSKYPHTCLFCGLHFESHGDVTEHFKVHSHRFPFKCNQCNSAFSNKHLHKAHIAVSHTPDKCFTCKVCNKSFLNYASLRRHMKRHSDPAT